MGDRGNVYIRGANVYLYTHWGGSALPQTVQAALSRRERWDDKSYLARIIFCEMVKGQEDGATGFGISTSLCDNEHPIVVINPENQTVGFAPEPEHFTDAPGKNRMAWPFESYIKMTPAALDRAFQKARRSDNDG